MNQKTYLGKQRMEPRRGGDDPGRSKEAGTECVNVLANTVQLDEGDRMAWTGFVDGASHQVTRKLPSKNSD